MIALINSHPIKSTCASVAAAVGSWTLGGVLSGLASIFVIVVSAIQIYDWIQKRNVGK